MHHPKPLPKPLNTSNPKPKTLTLIHSDEETTCDSLRSITSISQTKSNKSHQEFLLKQFYGTLLKLICLVNFYIEFLYKWIVNNLKP
jgi:hypothetical protein